MNGEAALSGNQIFQDLDLGQPQTVRNKHVGVMSHPVHGTLLQQPEHSSPPQESLP